MAEGMHLYIHLDELTQNSAMAGGVSEKSSTASNGDKGAQMIQSAAKKLVSYAAVKATANKVISYQLSQVELQTGATEYEQRLQANYQIANQAISAVETVAFGALVGGPLGAIAGLVAVAVSGINQAISIAQKQNTLNTEKNLEDITIGLQRIRAGTSGRRGGNQ